MSNKILDLDTLRLQLFNISYLNTFNFFSNNSNLLFKKITEDIYALIVQDIGHNSGEYTITWESIKHFGLSKDALFEKAQLNSVVSDFNLIQRQVLKYPEGIIEFGVSNGFYQGACVLEILKRMDNKNGIILSLPNWHHFAMIDIQEKINLQKLIFIMKKIIDKVYK